MNTSSLAQKLYRSSQTENGQPREAWALARRLAGYLSRSRVKSGEELAFSRPEVGRVGVARFRRGPRGKFLDFVMISIGPAGISAATWKQLTQLAENRVVEVGQSWKPKL
jgi:hypothetical protein